VYLLFVAMASPLVAWLAEGARGLPVDVVVIALIVAANALIGFLQESKAESAVAALASMTSVRSTGTLPGRSDAEACERNASEQVGQTLERAASVLRTRSLARAIRLPCERFRRDASSRRNLRGGEPPRLQPTSVLEMYPLSVPGRPRWLLGFGGYPSGSGMGDPG